ncbi:peroxisomal sarcosine oxidase [Microcaecilia unicolor]|uniref:Peroxisomal sarcosine oxidase n=1 Tax=Microcaecilia unicolor TaxID=1415580 RepID=A0A6P7WEV6_9AMPH|nr:peroxisomal sarcosine oxidase [Microcaecilia unicolor]
MAAQSGSSVYDCIVIGAGIQGSFTAYHLSKHKRRTLLLEQFPLPHSRGSSHGQTRITRKAYPQEFYTKMMAECYQLWAELETESNTTLYRQTGLLLLGPEENPEFCSTWRSLVQNQVPCQYLMAQEIQQRFPGVCLQPGEAAFIDHTAGVLYADKALRAVQDLFCHFGGTIRDGEKVVDIKPGSVVTVTTTSGIYQAKSLVVAAGPWTNKLMASLGLQLPLQTLKINVCYWKEKVPGSYGVPQNFPCFLGFHLNKAQHHIYGLPSKEYPGLIKVCYHHGNEVDPDERDREAKTPGLQEIPILSDFISKYLPGLEAEPAVIEHCMYTNTPDENFILDRHPSFQNIIVGAGFSGHGFKLSPMVGKILCELSMGKAPDCDLQPFRIQRFQNHLKSAL